MERVGALHPELSEGISTIGIQLKEAEISLLLMSWERAWELQSSLRPCALFLELDHGG